MKTQYLLTLLLSTLLFACGGSSSSDSPQLAPELQELKGAWQVPCNIDPDDNDSSEDVFTFTNSGLSVYSAQFSDNECTQLELELKISSAINYAGEKMIGSGQTVNMLEIDIDTDQILIRFHNPETIKSLNTSNKCNRTDWGNNTYINISTCEDFTVTVESFNERIRDIYFITGDQLYWGDTEQAVDGNGFPITLETGYSTRIN